MREEDEWDAYCTQKDYLISVLRGIEGSQWFIDNTTGSVSEDVIKIGRYKGETDDELRQRRRKLKEMEGR